MQGYAYAVHKKLGVPLDQIVVAHYYPITNNFVSCKYSPNQIKQYLKEKVDQIWKIRKMKKDEFRAMRNQFCNWCGYKNLCPEFNSGRLCEERIENLKNRNKKNRKRSS